MRENQEAVKEFPYFNYVQVTLEGEEVVLRNPRAKYCIVVFKRHEWQKFIEKIKEGEYDIT